MSVRELLRAPEHLVSKVKYKDLDIVKNLFDLKSHFLDKTP